VNLPQLHWKSALYPALLAGAFLAAVIGSWAAGAQVDNSAYDFMFRRYEPKPWVTQSILLAIDEPTLLECGGIRGIRKPLAEGLRRIGAASPRVVAVDVILADRGEPAADAALDAAFQAVPNLVLSSELIDGGRQWEDPLPEFQRFAAAVGHAHAQPDDNDAVTRAIPLEKRAGKERRWAISLEAFRLSRHAQIVESSNAGLQVGSTVIPAWDPPWKSASGPGGGDGRLMRIRFVPPNMLSIPRISLRDLLGDASVAAKFTDKVVFVGVTAQTEVRDRLYTPYAFGTPTTGVEIHANAFETMAQGLFITDVPNLWVLLFSVALVAAAGLVFAYVPGWPAYALCALILLTAHVTPYIFFTRQRVFSFATPAAAAWFAAIAAAAYQTLVVRRSLTRAEARSARYQQAMHFVTHEMRTPLSAIQGSSELISRYALNEEKRKQIALLINSESKRLARMIEVFLNVERLSAGEMELKREDIPVKDLLDICMERARPIASRKNIAIAPKPVDGDPRLSGDRELMEYACYNLLTNAVKYSPQRTQVMVSAWLADGQIRIAVEDQGIGMDSKEVKNIFQKFYRTKKAEESGEPGSGIGLSIVQQIVEQHGGRIDVASQPGVGSCFTLVLPAAAQIPVSTDAERH
jgi:signal transduction histidine kinase